MHTVCALASAFCTWIFKWIFKSKMLKTQWKNANKMAAKNVGKQKSANHALKNARTPMQTIQNEN